MAEREGILLPEVSCGGLLGAAHAGAAAAADRHPFALPGDRPVWGRDRPFAVEHIALEFSFDLARREVSGVATTTFRPRTDGLREAVFDARELVVESVTDGSGRELPFRLGERSLHVDLRRPRSSRRRITTVVRYRARPRRGLYFNAPDPDDPERPRQIWTQGQAEDSAYYFPCFDYPGERATSEVTATVPAGWFVLSNGRLASRREDRRRRRVTYHWRQERPHPAYLVTLVAGELVSVEESARGAGPGGADVPVRLPRPGGEPTGAAARLRPHAGDGALLRRTDRHPLPVGEVRHRRRLGLHLRRHGEHLGDDDDRRAAPRREGTRGPRRALRLDSRPTSSPTSGSATS